MKSGFHTYTTQQSKVISHSQKKKKKNLWKDFFYPSIFKFSTFSLFHWDLNEELKIERWISMYFQQLNRHNAICRSGCINSCQVFPCNVLSLSKYTYTPKIITGMKSLAWKIFIPNKQKGKKSRINQSIRYDDWISFPKFTHELVRSLYSH